jgi:prepilin-type N-terminal cleavage/methylation domain-containing protein
VKNSQYSNRKGFSLIEVAVAISVLGLMFGGMLMVFDRGALASRKTQQQAVAYNLARAFLEQYSNWNGLDGLDGAFDGVVTNNTYTNPPLPATINNIVYIPSLAVSDGPINPTQLKQLDITISWTDGAVARNVTLSTLKANY